MAACALPGKDTTSASPIAAIAAKSINAYWYVPYTPNIHPAKMGPIAPPIVPKNKIVPKIEP